MKKVILGVGLLICGFISYLAYHLELAIYFASTKAMIYGSKQFSFYLGIAMVIAGVIFIYLGFKEDK